MIYINYIKLFSDIMYSIYAASTRPREYYRLNLWRFKEISTWPS